MHKTIHLVGTMQTYFCSEIIDFPPVLAQPEAHLSHCGQVILIRFDSFCSLWVLVSAGDRGDIYWMTPKISSDNDFHDMLMNRYIY